MKQKKLLSLLLSAALVLTMVIAPGSSVFAAEGKTVINVPSTVGLEKKTFDFSAPSDGFYRFNIPAGNGDENLRCGVYLNGSTMAEYSVWYKSKFDCTLQLKSGDRVTVSVGCEEDRTLNIEKVDKEISGKEGSIKWTLNPETGMLKVSGKGTVLGTEWDGNAKLIKTVQLSKGITKIGKYAFANRDFGRNAQLQAISFPNTVTTIAYGAFDHCEALTEIALPSKLQKIETGAFIFCRNLKNVKVSGGKTNTKLKSIGNAAFAGCDNLKSLTIPWGVTTIGNCAYGYTDSKTDELSDWDMVNKIMVNEAVPKLKGASINGINYSLAYYYAKENGIKFVGTQKGSKLKAPKVTIKHNDDPRIVISKVAGATGYELFYKGSFDKGWKKVSLKNGKRTYSIHMRAGDKYKARAYKKLKSGGYQYSDFSKVKTIK